MKTTTLVTICQALLAVSFAFIAVIETVSYLIPETNLPLLKWHEIAFTLLIYAVVYVVLWIIKEHQDSIFELTKSSIVASVAAMNTENLTRKVEKLVDIVETSQQHYEQLMSVVQKDQENTTKIIDYLMKGSENKTT